MRSPYTRPFDHPINCGCPDCRLRGKRRFWIGGVGLVLTVGCLVAIAGFGVPVGKAVGAALIVGFVIVAAWNVPNDNPNPNEEPRP